MKTHYRFASLLVTFPFLSLGCGEERSVDEHIDEGELCFSQLEPTVLRVGVVSGTCYSGSCSEFLEVDCSVEREGTTIRVKNVLRVEQWGGNCTDDCVSSVPTCQLAGVDAGEYRVIHGEYEMTVTLPLQDGRWAENPESFWGCAP